MARPHQRGHQSNVRVPSQREFPCGLSRYDQSGHARAADRRSRCANNLMLGGPYVNNGNPASTAI